MEEQTFAQINGRPVLQPTCNRLELRNSLKKISPPQLFPSPGTPRAKLSPSPPITPKPKSPITGSDPNSIEKVLSPSYAAKLGGPVKRSGKEAGNGGVEASRSLAEARREEVANMQVLRKIRIAHYGRRAHQSANSEIKVTPELLESLASAAPARQEKRCNFITLNSDPIYVAYHDEEWGVPVHDDKLLFELLVLTAAQVGSDWTSVLKRREHLRRAFEGFDADVVAKFSDRKIASINSDNGMELNYVRGAVENAKQILKIKEGYGSFDNYLWRFVNSKPISTQYKTSQKIPVKTSKSEAISKDLVKRGFRFVGPAVIHSFMQAAGLINAHLISCPRRLQCTQLAQNAQNNITKHEWLTSGTSESIG
ncbi:hypothetical protein Nepgr_032873 [Nepenthes gracilis]|uniref:DNA-3-methyladenine glycosylase I n=1 Tax=Nepenthes gracilis TaxID=150966 RepID=A0AAD3TK61_NEPGR|nr:hypothetical protein Nepgr_032873 [Nepenthes gracilis]